MLPKNRYSSSVYILHAISALQFHFYIKQYKIWLQNLAFHELFSTQKFWQQFVTWADIDMLNLELYIRFVICT